MNECSITDREIFRISAQLKRTPTRNNTRRENRQKIKERDGDTRKARLTQ